MRAAAEWLGDLARLAWGLLYWNLSKSLFRIRGAKGRAPCQHPSDSGRAGRTGCVACAGWSRPGRFRRLCPLLETAADGRRVCSVDAADVRPFWGRALLLSAGSAAALALAGALSVFLALRAVGYRVPLQAVLWPPAWHRVHQARSDYFYRMAARSFSAGDVRQGLLALNEVYALDPGNVGAALLLAQFTQVANPDYSDSIYRRLLLQGRANPEETAQAWFRALLARGDFASLGRLSARMLREGAAHAPAWSEGLLFAERMTGDPGEVDRLLAQPGRTPGVARSVLSLARDLRTGSADDWLRRAKLSVAGSTDPFELYYSLGRLAELGRGADVVAFLDGPSGASLGPYDRESLKLDACSFLGWDVLERREIATLLERGTSAPVVTLVAAHLIRHPNAEAAASAFGQLELSPPPGGADNAGVHMTLLCMAGVNGLDARMKQEARLLGWVAGGRFAGWGRITEFFESPAREKNPAVFLPSLHQLPLEVVYALAAHYRARAPAAPAAPAG